MSELYFCTQARANITEVHFLPFNPVDKRTAITYIDSEGQWHRVSKGAPEQVWKHPNAQMGFLSWRFCNLQIARKRSLEFTAMGWPSFSIQWILLKFPPIALFVEYFPKPHFFMFCKILSLCEDKEAIAGKVHAAIDRFAERGLRSLGVAYQVRKWMNDRNETLRSYLQTGRLWLGLLGMTPSVHSWEIQRERRWSVDVLWTAAAVRPAKTWQCRNYPQSIQPWSLCEDDNR